MLHPQKALSIAHIIHQYAALGVSVVAARECSEPLLAGGVEEEEPVGFVADKEFFDAEVDADGGGGGVRVEEVVGVAEEERGFAGGRGAKEEELYCGVFGGHFGEVGEGMDEGVEGGGSGGDVGELVGVRTRELVGKLEVGVQVMRDCTMIHVRHWCHVGDGGGGVAGARETLTRNGSKFILRARSLSLLVKASKSFHSQYSQACINTSIIPLFITPFNASSFFPSAGPHAP